LITGIGALVAVFANPLAGALSDRTASRFGRRHPRGLDGSLVSAAALFLLARQRTIIGIAVGWCLAQAGLNAMQAGLAAGVPDRVPVFVLWTSDARLARADRAPFRWRTFFASLWPDPVRHPDFGWAWLTRFLMVLGNSMAVLYLLYCLRDRSDFQRYFPGKQAATGLVILLTAYTTSPLTRP
jgi:hypothetical protein